MWLAFPARWATPTAQAIPSLGLLCPSSARRSRTPPTVEKLEGILAFANKAASITTSRHGAIPAMPTLEEIEK